jgi:choline dehydrogenase
MNRVQITCASIGIPSGSHANNPNGPAVSCAGMDLSLDERGRRCSASHAFLPRHLVQARRNLNICSEAIVTAIILEDEQAHSKGPANHLARGVHIEPERGPSLSSSESNPFFARARKEVILCAGAIGTPQILLLRSDSNI